MKIVLTYLIIFNLLCSCSNEKVSDSLDNYKNYYGINIFSDLSEKQLLNDLYSESGLYKLLREIKSNPEKMTKLENYIKRINTNDLFGFAFRDSILKYISLENNAKLFDVLNNNRNKDNTDEIDNIIEIRSNALLNKDKYSDSSFCFSTALHRKEYHEISLILPNTNWEELDSNLDNNSIISGEGSYAGTVFYRKEVIKESSIEEIEKLFFASYRLTISKSEPKENEDYMYRIEPGKVYLIKENYIIGKMKFDKIFEQITVSPDDYNYQILVLRARYYVINNSVYIVGIMSLMNGNHILANKTDLIKLHGLILDTLKFDD